VGDRVRLSRPAAWEPERQGVEGIVQSLPGGGQIDPFIDWADGKQHTAKLDRLEATR